MHKSFYKSLAYIVIFVNYFMFINGMLTETHWQTAVEISDYTSYASSSMLFFTIPEWSIRSLWQLSAYKEPNTDKCEERTVVVYLQANSFPVISPLNETFPKDFNTIRTELHNVQLSTNNKTVEFFIDVPSPGGWYMKVYLGDYVDESIKQKGFGTDCRYYVASVNAVSVLDTVTEVPIDKQVEAESKYEISEIYRFLTTENTFQYHVIIEDCKVNGSNPLSPCPVRLSTRSLAIPDFDSTRSNVMNCSSVNDTKCVFSVSSPATQAWQYIMFESIADEVVQLMLTVQLIKCVNDQIILESKIMANVVAASNNQTVENQTVYDVNLNKSDENGVNDSQSALSNDIKTKKSDENDMNGSQKTEPNLVVHDSSTLSLSLQKQMIVYRPSQASSSNSSCTIIPQLGRFEIPTQMFFVDFRLRFNVVFPVTASIVVTDTKPVILYFKMVPGIDIGGTLKYFIQMETRYLNNSRQVARVHSCIQRLGIPLSGSGIACHQQNYLQVNSTGILSRQVFFPYPEPGPWYITMIAECVNAENTNISEPCQQDAIAVYIQATLKPCVDGGCGTYGSCYSYYSTHHRYSSCRCIANYRGYGCTDDTVADPDSLQLASALLLTLSNLMFLPAIALSLYRRFFPEALSYTYTMFFSTFYHACDGSRKYIYCMMPYNVLSFCDFFGAIMSVWVTCVALSRLNERFRSFLFLTAGLFIAMGVTWDRYSLWTFAVPGLCGLAVMSASWGRFCYNRKQCYPSKKRWLFFLIPGIVIAGGGMIVYAFFETESNYWYTHSFWHACMAICIVFLLPPRSKDVEGIIHGSFTLKISDDTSDSPTSASEARLGETV